MSNPGPVTSDVLSVRGLSKAYGAVQALRDVSIDCRAGEIHALVGENGSGKSTLLGIASGFLAPDQGAVEIGGSRLAHHSPAAARRLGLGIAYQDYSHVLELSVAENLFLAVPADARPAYGEMQSWAEETLATFKLDIAVTAPPGSLPLADRQLLEVAKSLLTRPKVLLLDEPTTALGPEAVERLHTLVLEQVREGVGVVYVSHRLPEVLAVADRVTVLRDGVRQGTFEAASVSEDALVALMIGRPLTVAFPERPSPAEHADVVLAVSGLRGERFGPVDLEVRKGEILGIAGAEGNGQVPFLRALAGVEPAIGSASCDGAKLDTRSPAGPLRAGVVLLSGDRRGEALFPVLSVRANATIQVLRRLARGGIVLHSRERHAIAGLVERLRVRMASSEQPVQSLSGGNQQKVSLIRPFLRGDVKVILAEEPTQGVDVGARFDIYEALRAKADEGIATVLKSSDPIELAGLCDRVIVMSRGRIVEEIPRHELGERRIVEAIVGSRAGARAAVREDQGERA
jgi:ribose transport system ATP-binding protein